MRSVVDNETFVRKIQFPRLVIPLSVVMLAFFNLCLNLVVVTIFALAAGVRPMLSWLELPLIVALLVVLSTGIAMLLSALFVYLRDIQPIWEVLSQVIFYASPIIIPVVTVQQHLSPTLLHIYMLNPLAVILQQFRHAFITHATPSAGAAGFDGRAARAARDHCGDFRVRLLGVQPDRAAGRRGSLSRISALANDRVRAGLVAIMPNDTPPTMWLLQTRYGRRPSGLVRQLVQRAGTPRSQRRLDAWWLSEEPVIVRLQQSG